MRTTISTRIITANAAGIANMLVAAFFVLAAFLFTWLIFSLLAYTFIYGSLILSYCFLWDAKTRHAICPRGLWHALLYDE